MKNHMDVEELKDLLALVIELIDCSYLIAKDGGLSLSDISNVWGVVEKVGPAFRGANKIPDELADLDIEDCDELIHFVMSELNFGNAHAKLVVEKSLKALKACYEVYLEVNKE